MNVLDLLKSLEARASHLEEEAKALRLDARQIQTLLFGTVSVEDAPEAPSNGPVASVKKAAAPKMPKMPKMPEMPEMPSRNEIRAKAAQFNVDVDDLLPPGKKPTLQAKQDAMKRIVKAKRLAAEAKVSSTVDLSDVV